MVKVSSASGKYLGVANTWWQLEDILNKADAHPSVHVEESKYELPTMLITTKVMDAVHDAVNEHREKGTPISECIRLKRLDQHIVGGMKNVSLSRCSAV